jgi:hypothetical protein
LLSLTTETIRVAGAIQIKKVERTFGAEKDRRSSRVTVRFQQYSRPRMSRLYVRKATLEWGGEPQVGLGWNPLAFVMPGHVPGIHVFLDAATK